MKLRNCPVVCGGIRNFVLSALVVSVPMFAAAQHKSAPAPRPSAPAPHASAPVHNSMPSRPAQPMQQHSNMPQHNTGGTMNRPGMGNTNHMGGPGAMNNSRTPMGNNGRTMNNTAGTHGMNNAPGHNGTNNMGNRAGTSNMGNRPGTNNMGNHNGNMGNRPGANNGMHAGNTGRPGAPARGTMNRTPPGHQVSLRGGGTAHIRPNGQIRSINRNGMQIQHGMHGGRTIVSSHNGARVVTTGRHGGYVQRNYVVRNGHTYVSRTYVVNNVTYTSVYRSYSYGGYCCYYGYAPAYYYHPVYYGWAYNPWPGPVYYGWGWAGEPWYGYYGPYYYQPYPVYPSAAFWITDWMIAASLRASYEASLEVGQLDPLGQDFPLVAGIGMLPVAPDAAKNVVLSKEVKDLLAEEIKTQIAEDQADASKGKSSGGNSGGQASDSGPLPSLNPKRRVFVVHNELSVVADGDECSLTGGDVISRVSDTPDDDKNVDVKVLASKKNDCGVGKEVAVSLDDLQEMHNHFREQITGGMDELAKKQGSGGLPKAPDTGKQDGEVPAPAADSSAAKALKEQQSDADKTESEVKQEASSSGGGSQ